jgi:proline iminopeptidase
MQVVYLDLRDHGRSDRGDPAAWSFEACADDVPAVCDALGIERPIVLGHSMGGFVAILTASRHPGHAGGLILLSTIARFDLDRLTEGVRAAAGDEVAALARRDYGGDEVAANEWARVFAAFGPHVPNVDVLARRIQNLDVAAVGMDLMRGLDLRDQLPRIASPTLVCVGSLDPVTSVSASREIATGLAPGVGRLEVLEGAGHFPWLDDPDAVFGVIRSFASTVTAGA